MLTSPPLKTARKTNPPLTFYFRLKTLFITRPTYTNPSQSTAQLPIFTAVTLLHQHQNCKYICSLRICRPSLRGRRVNFHDFPRYLAQINRPNINGKVKILPCTVKQLMQILLVHYLYNTNKDTSICQSVFIVIQPQFLDCSREAKDLCLEGR